VRLPLPGVVTQRFGENPEYYARWGLQGHNGVDIGRPRTMTPAEWHETPLVSLSDGVAWHGSSEGYGLYLYVVSGRTAWLYAHLASILVDDGARVSEGEPIARVGYSGTTVPVGEAGGHLHLGERVLDAEGNVADLDNGYRGYVDPLREQPEEPSEPCVPEEVPPPVDDAAGVGLHLVTDWLGCLPAHANMTLLMDASEALVRAIRQHYGAAHAIVYRRWHSVEEQGQILALRPDAFRRWLAPRVAEWEQLNRQYGPLYFHTPINEPSQRDSPRAAMLFEAFVEYLAERNMFAAGPAFGSGRPEEDELRTFWGRGADLIRQTGGLWLHHCYWSDEADLRQVWHAHRYQLCRDWLPVLRQVRWAIGECGRDYHKDTGGGPWLGPTGCNSEQYLDELHWYAAEVRRRGILLSPTVFTAGRIWDRWRLYDVARIADKL